MKKYVYLGGYNFANLFGSNKSGRCAQETVTVVRVLDSMDVFSQTQSSTEHGKSKVLADLGESSILSSKCDGMNSPGCVPITYSIRNSHLGEVS